MLSCFCWTALISFRFAYKFFPGNLLSMGYGFVEYRKKSDALKAIKQLQVCS